MCLREGSEDCGTDVAVDLVGLEDLDSLLDNLGVEILEACAEELGKISPEVSFLTSTTFLGFLKLDNNFVAAGLGLVGADFEVEDNLTSALTLLGLGFSPPLTLGLSRHKLQDPQSWVGHPSATLWGFFNFFSWGRLLRLRGFLSY